MISRRSLAFGTAVLLAGTLWLIWAAGGAAQIEHGGPAATRTPRPSPTPAGMPGATPTVDRLAAPPTVPSPNQADEGAQLYWLHCQPCHGDRGQGLTDEWRAQYPPEEEYCWESGCHGERPYDQAFALPTSVPAVIDDSAGSGANLQVLQKFETMDGLYRYVSVSMPYFFPGELTQEEYLAILAHLARENGLWDGATLTTDNLARYRLRPEAATAITTGGHLAQATAVPEATSAPDTSMGEAGLLGLGALIIILAGIGGVALWRNHGR